MLARLFGFFQAKEEKPNQLEVHLNSYRFEYQDGFVAEGSGRRFDVNESVCSDIDTFVKARKVRKTTPNISMDLTLTGVWNGKEINEKFTDLILLQNYLTDHSIIHRKNEVKLGVV